MEKIDELIEDVGGLSKDVGELTKTVDTMSNEWKELKLTLEGNPRIGTKPVVTRIFEAINDLKTSLPCAENTRKLNEIYERQARANGYADGANSAEASKNIVKSIVLSFLKLRTLDKLIVSIIVIVFLFVFGANGISLI